MSPLDLFAEGCVIPAHPLALTAERKLDERRQKAVGRYYTAAGAGGMAVGVHTTQFPIHDNGMLKPVLEIALEAAREADRPLVMVAGVQGDTKQAVAEARQARNLGYHMALLRPAPGSDDEMLVRAKAVGEVLPVIGFYLQPAVGGRVLSRDFWRRFAALDCVAGIKVAPFDRYRTLDVLNGVAQSGRHTQIALYTGNDNNILGDLITPYDLESASGRTTIRFVGGLLGQFAVWTTVAVDLLRKPKEAMGGDAGALSDVLRADGQLTDANAALFDVANNFHGCIAGCHEVLRRQGLMQGIWCLDPREGLSPGQLKEIDRVTNEHADLSDDDFVAAHRDKWLA